MSPQANILRLESARNTLRAKGVELGISTSTDKLDTIATKFDSDLANQGAVSATVKEGETYTVPKGYHNGSGTVSGVAGGGQYGLQSKAVTPTKLQQNITPDSGFYGLSDVTLNPIPDIYQDVSGVTVAQGDVLSTKTFVKADGTRTAGTMPNNGAAGKTLTTESSSFSIPAGYHNGAGSVVIVPETKSATPTESAQNIVATTGKVLEKVSVGAIPAKYKDATGTDALAANILAGKKAVTTAGSVTGSMVNNGAVNGSVNGLNVVEYIIPAGYHNGAGKVVLTNDIENALAAI